MTNLESKIVTIENEDINVHTWMPKDSKPKGTCVVFHGFLAHGLYPTVRYAAELLAAKNFKVVAADMHGHGKSSGTPGLLESSNAVIQSAVKVARYAKGEEGFPFFLVGSSMGGTIALHVSQLIPSNGVVLLAPMLKLSVSAPERVLLSGLAAIPGLNLLSVIPSASSNAEKQYRDPKRRQECEEAATFKGSCIRVASANTCVQLAHDIPSLFPKMKVPFFLAVAKEDVVVKNQGSYDLYENATSSDKTLKEYDALHGLLCEPSPLVDQIKADILEWIEARC